MVVRVREISDDEGNRLRRIVRHGQNAIEVKRAQVILASAQGFTPPKIGVIALMSEDYIRQLIHAFNLHGFAMLKPHWGPGPKAKFSEDQREALVALATSRPKDLDLPFTQWSLSRLRKAAMDRGLVPSISEEWLRVILLEADLSHQSLRTWKKSTDPEREVKKEYIEKLTRQPHNPPVVLSGDEIGPIQLVPQGGSGWFPKRCPGRIPAEYHRELRDGLLLPDAERLPPAVVGDGLSDQALDELAGVPEGGAVEVPRRRAGVSHPGRVEHALDAGGARVGEATRGGAGADGHSRELDEPRRDPREGDRGTGAARYRVHLSAGLGGGAGSGGGVSERGATRAREAVPGHRAEESTARLKGAALAPRYGCLISLLAAPLARNGLHPGGAGPAEPS